MKTFGVQQHHRYCHFLIVSFVILFLCTDFIAAVKICKLGSFNFEGRLILFPLSYFFDDVLTEVYGYSYGRKAIWYGFLALVFANAMSWLVIILPAAEDWPHQSKLEVILGQSIRVIFASLISFLVSKFVNIYLVAKMKIWMKGRHAWRRSFGASIVGEVVDSFLFYLISFLGDMPLDYLMTTLMLTLSLKLCWLVIMIPVVHFLTEFLERKEGTDHYDRYTDFNPFVIEL